MFLCFLAEKKTPSSTTADEVQQPANPHPTPTGQESGLVAILDLRLTNNYRRKVELRLNPVL